MNDSGFEIALPEDFRFQACLSYMSRSPRECLFQVDEGGVTRLIPLEGEAQLVRITCPGDHTMCVRRLDGQPFSEKIKVALIGYIRDWFDLDRDLAPFYSLAARDPLLGRLAEEHYGLRLVGVPDLFEALCWAIVGQQVNLTFAYKLKQQITERYGESVMWQGVTYWRFPQPEVLARASAEELGELQLTRAKAATIRETALRMANGELSKAKLHADDNPLRTLTAIKGIGPWTAQYVLMRCLRDPAAFLPGDVGLQNAVKLLKRMERKPTPAELLELAAGWRGWEAYAAFFLWRALY